ncbi:MAG: LysM peptidoglycan-binding domain-containing protein, partial [Dehalococcoidia bacterium]
MALVAVLFATRFSSESTSAVTDLDPPQALFSGLSAPSASESVLRPGTGVQTRDSVLSLTARSDASLVRTSGGISPNTSISSGVSAAAADSGETGGTSPLADIIDPRQPYALVTVGAGATISGLASQYGVTMETILDNNPEISDKNLLVFGQQIIVPRDDGILHKVGLGETVSSIVKLYDNIDVATVLGYRPNALSDSTTLESGSFVLLVGATHKP